VRVFLAGRRLVLYLALLATLLGATAASAAPPDGQTVAGSPGIPVAPSLSAGQPAAGRFQDVIILQPSPGGTGKALSLSFTVGGCDYAVNDTVYTMAVAPFIKNDRIYLPVRCMAHALGMGDADIAWDPAGRAAAISGGGHRAVFALDSTTYTVDGAPHTMEAAPTVVEDYMCLPVSYFANAFGYNVIWRQQEDPVPAAARLPAGARGLYVVVDTAIPEHLYVCRDASVVLATYCNTGVPQAPTPTGIFTVLAKMASDDMAGTNPDGSKYFDPGVPWVMYFYGGCAIHGFVRPRYGYPQSVGCVELPVATAKKVYDLVPVGTRVYIE